MKAIQTQQQHSFDLFRVSKAKQVVDLCSNTLYVMAKKGLIKIYRNGRSSWCSKSEVEAAIRQGVLLR